MSLFFAVNQRKVATVASVAMLALVHSSGSGVAAAKVSITGNWAGKGTVVLSSGKKEHVSCRVTYGRIAGQEFSLQAKCASAGTRIDQSGQLTRIRSNRYEGSVLNKQFNINASIVVTVSNGKQTVSISSDEGKVQLRLSRR